jgi:hypothetical protein
MRQIMGGSLGRAAARESNFSFMLRTYVPIYWELEFLAARETLPPTD